MEDMDKKETNKLSTKDDKKNIVISNTNTNSSYESGLDEKKQSRTRAGARAKSSSSTTTSTTTTTDITGSLSEDGKVVKKNIKKESSTYKNDDISSVAKAIYEDTQRQLNMSKEEIDSVHDSFMKTLNFGWGDSTRTPSFEEFVDEYTKNGIKGIVEKLKGPSGKKNPLSELLVRMSLADPNISDVLKDDDGKEKKDTLQDNNSSYTSNLKDPSSESETETESESDEDTRDSFDRVDLNAFKIRKEFSEFLKSRYGDSIGLKKVNTEAKNENFPDIRGFSFELECKPLPDGSMPPIPKNIDEEFKKYLTSKYKGVEVVSVPLKKEPSSRNLSDIFGSISDNLITDFSRRKEEKYAGRKKSSAADTDKKPDYKNFNYTPKQIKAYLDRFVIKQDEAKKALAIAVCDHYNHVKECLNNPKVRESDYAKQNVLILGPTGVGKTYLIKQIAKLIGVPFVKADATRFSETGYVGANVDDLVTDLVQQAGGDENIAQYGIIYLDEADKLAAKSTEMSKDISGRGVQFGLLKLMEETDVDLRSNHDMRSQLQSFMEFQRTGQIAKKLINTRHILFIISGSFNYLADIIKKRLNQNAIGFANELYSFKNKDDYFQYASTADFVEFGFEPEFIGRLPVRVSCQSLSAKDLFSILKNSEGSIIKQYKASFRNYGIEVEFDDGALMRIAELAFLEKTGARALMTVCERIFRDFKFELPSSSVKGFTVTASLVDHPREFLDELLKNSSNDDDDSLKN